MTKPQRDAGMGVIVGRFQVPTLHEGHIHLIEQVIERHGTAGTLIVLGSSEVFSVRNPLSFVQRYEIIKNHFEHVSIEPIVDHPSDEHWSQNLDELIGLWADDHVPVTLYGSRDSFKPHYHGRFRFEELPEHPSEPSGDAVRKEIHEEWSNVIDPSSPIEMSAFAAGVIWASARQFPTVYTTVDAILTHHSAKAVLLGRKKGQTKWCFIGGFADPGSNSDRADLLREIEEETGIKATVCNYLGDFPVDDWRYRSGPHAVRTRLFSVTVPHLQIPQANDDIEEVRWFEYTDVPGALAPNHLAIWHRVWAGLR